MNIIFFDLEGPLAPQDNAYELMKLFPQGGKVFEVLSRYDDLLTLEGKAAYEPGDTLALIVPFLLYHGIEEANIRKLAEAASLTPGASNLMSRLHSQGWQVFCISTSYQQYAGHITAKLGIPPGKLACTTFPLDQFHRSLNSNDLAIVGEIEKQILPLRPVADDQVIKEKLDSFFWKQLPSTKLGEIVTKVKPVGGKRKVEALERFAQQYAQPLSQCAVVGDSITDFPMLETVNRAGGLAVAFNANEYALPYATVGLASTHLDDLLPLLDVWQQGGRPAVEEWGRSKEKVDNTQNRGHFHWLAGRKDLELPLQIHGKIRRLVREEAAQLG